MHRYPDDLPPWPSPDEMADYYREERQEKEAADRKRAEKHESMELGE